MRIMMIQPNYHSGGAEIAGNWPPSWVPYVGGALKQAGFDNICFIDGMTNYITDENLAKIIAAQQPDVVLATAITPMIYQSQKTLKFVREVCPQAKTIMGGVHPTYMYNEVLQEAPWVDYIIRGEGEEITVNLLSAIANGTDKRDRHDILGIAFRENGKVVATPAHPPIKNLDTLSPDWSLLDWNNYYYTPLNVRLAVPNYARGCPFRCRFCSQWKFWRKYRSRSPKKFVDEIEILVKEYGVGFFILADEEPTINKPKFVALCHELIERKLDIHWGINTRVTDILRDVALIDLSLPDKNGVLLTQEFRQIQQSSDNPDLKICILIDSQNETEILTAFQAQATAYCLKNASIEQLVDMIIRSHQGQYYLAPQIATVLLNCQFSGIFTETERELLSLIAQGMNAETIATKLSISLDKIHQEIGKLLNHLSHPQLTPLTVSLA